MEKFYLLRTESDPKVIGVKNGIKQVSIERSGYSHPEKYDELLRVLGSNQYWEYKENIINFELEIQCVQCLPGAKLTDFLLFGPFLHHCPFLVSERLYNTLLEVKLSRHKFFIAKVFRSTKTYNYYLPYIPPLKESVIDYSKSTFRSSFDICDGNTYKFTSEDDALAFAKNNVGLMGKNIFLNKDFNRKLDLYPLNFAGLVISERLKNTLESAKIISGSKILPAFGNVPWPTIEIASSAEFE